MIIIATLQISMRSRSRVNKRSGRIGITRSGRSRRDTRSWRWRIEGGRVREVGGARGVGVGEVVRLERLRGVGRVGKEE